MIELLLIYKWTFLAGLFSSAALALIGCQVAARNQSVQTLVVSQAASFGVVAGLALAHGCCHAASHEEMLLPVISGFLLSAFFYFFCERVIARDWVSRNTYYIGIFGVLMAATYTLIGLVPSLETHMSEAYFGDLTLASDAESISVLLLSLAALIALNMRWRAVTSWSFESMMFGSFVAGSAERRGQGLFIALSLLLIVASVQLLGLLFTLSALFLPSMVLVKRHRGISGLRSKIVVSTVLGTTMGFLVSLGQGSLPTVPAITIGLLISSGLISLLWRKRF